MLAIEINHSSIYRVIPFHVPCTHLHSWNIYPPNLKIITLLKPTIINHIGIQTCWSPQHKSCTKGSLNFMHNSIICTHESYHPSMQDNIIIRCQTTIINRFPRLVLSGADRSPWYRIPYRTLATKPRPFSTILASMRSWPCVAGDEERLPRESYAKPSPITRWNQGRKRLVNSVRACLSKACLSST